MSTAPASAVRSDSPPDWANFTDNISCPLCEYNLRGLIEPRCPECGFKFSWSELLDAERHRHPYLFEHHPKTSIQSFFLTSARDWRPRRFWRELNPAHPIRVGRLLAYWVLTNLALLIVLALPLVQSGISQTRQNAWGRLAWQLTSDGKSYQFNPAWRIVNGPSTMPVAQFNAAFPSVWSVAFARQVWNGNRGRMPVYAIVTVAGWTWLTLASLMIFQASMSRARIRNAHLLRCAIYGCDFPLLVGAALIFMLLGSGDPQSQVLAAAVVCLPVALYRLTFAYSRYLRFDHPFLTVLASQVIVFLIVFIVELNVGAF